MNKGYWIVRVDVTNPQEFQQYVKANVTALKQHGARFLVRGGQYLNPEGTHRERNTVVEFPSYQAAVECWNSVEYQDARTLRSNASVMDLVIIEGYDGLQP